MTPVIAPAYILLPLPHLHLSTREAIAATDDEGQRASKGGAINGRNGHLWRRSAVSKMLTLRQNEELADFSVSEPSRYGFMSFYFIAIKKIK